VADRVGRVNVALVPAWVNSPGSVDDAPTRLGPDTFAGDRTVGTPAEGPSVPSSSWTTPGHGRRSGPFGLLEFAG
jgi:hypothetical protein